MEVAPTAAPEPISLLEFQQRFPDDDACRAYLVQLRWPEGFRCPHCHHEHGYLLKRRSLYQCSACRHQASVTAGTLFHKSHIPLRKWFWAIYLITQDKRGVSAWYLSDALPLRYETAWFMLHKIRRAMTDRDDQFRLDGLVEIDDGYFGGVDHGRAGRGVASAKVVVAVSVQGKGPYQRPTYAKMGVLGAVSREQIGTFTQKACTPGAVIKSDGHSSYAVVAHLGFVHQPVVVKHQPEGAAAFPFVHTLISNAKMWLGGTFHGSVRPAYLSAYLAEFCYRFNRRKRHRQGFARLLPSCLSHAPVPWAEVTG